jgi:Cof subfamily protein (haloacid dehalogenase superfamily)
VRAAVTDLDGTVLDATFNSSPRTRAAIEAAEASGIVCLIATGRMFQSARRIAARLGVTGPLICYQGGMIGDAVTGEIMLHRPLEVPLAHELLEALGEWSRDTNAYVDDELYVTEENDATLRYARTAGVELHVVGDLRRWLTEPTTKLVTVGEPEKLDVLRDELIARFGGRAFIAKSLAFFLEFAAPGVSKGSALDFVSERLAFTPAQTVAFGDGENDRELLDWAALGVAVANADPDLLARADAVVPSVNEDGVAQFLEELVAARG